MTRITTINPDTAQGQVKTTFDGISKQLGKVPNLFRVFAQDPAVLQGYLAFSGALKGSSLGQKLGEQVALTIAGANTCDYCASAHATIGRSVGLTDRDITEALAGRAEGAKQKAALAFARKVVEQRGQVSDADVAEARAAGLGEAELVAIVAHVALNIFTNYMNHLAATEIDFPAVRAKAA